MDELTKRVRSTEEKIVADLNASGLAPVVLELILTNILSFVKAAEGAEPPKEENEKESDTVK